MKKDLKKVFKLKEKLSLLQKRPTKNNREQNSKVSKCLKNCKEKVKTARKKFESSKFVKEFNGVRENLI